MLSGLLLAYSRYFDAIFAISADISAIRASWPKFGYFMPREANLVTFIF